MAVEWLIVILLLVCGMILVYTMVRSELRKGRHSQDTQTLGEWISSLQLSLDRTNQTLSDVMRGSTRDMTKTLQENSKQLNERLDSAARLIGDLRQHLGEMSEVGKGIKSLQEFLQSPKLRGNIGEQVLSDMIAQAFPRNSYVLQYGFRSGAKADVVIKTDAGLLVIDAKFPLENYKRMYGDENEDRRNVAKKEFHSDVRKHIRDISQRYILPAEGTLDFALMYVPSESVYYEIITDMTAMDYAQDARVYPVSPNSLYAHLQVLLVSFQGKQMEQKSRHVFRLLLAIQKDYRKLEDHLGVLNRHISNAYNTMNSVSGASMLLGQKLREPIAYDQTSENRLPELHESTG